MVQLSGRPRGQRAPVGHRSDDGTKDAGAFAVSTKTRRLRSHSPPAPPTISYEKFHRLMAQRARPLLALAARLRKCKRLQSFLTRPLLSDLFGQASLLEELLDSYGAQTNRRWHPFRLLVATEKQFSDVNYVLLHIQHALPAYRLLPIEGDFASATDDARAFTGRVIAQTARALLEQARKLALDTPDEAPPPKLYSESLPTGRLPRDRTTRAVESAEATVARLATAFLNQAAKSELLHAPVSAEPEDYASCIPAPVNEEQLRQLTDDYHNLQSLYDTHVSDTQTESLDADLPTLRGHTSVIFHLLEAATGLTHYYQRHMAADCADSPEARRLAVVPADELLRTIMDYCLCYASRYLLRAQDLCQEMLGRYAEVARIMATAPRYRGFHVRPATLVSKIVRHYGSEVRMELEGESYDAGSPLEIFRANEKINARKRRWLAEEIARIQPEEADDLERNFSAAVRRLVLTLAEQGKVVIYERPLQIHANRRHQDARSALERVIDEVARLQATGKIDIEAEIEVTFVGDKRVLADLKLLAENGYGEDNFGNNTDLPKELSYLRR
jgi:hypothetical protein